MGRPENLSVDHNYVPSHERLEENVILYAGNSNPALTKSVATLLGMKAIFPIHRFSDGESHALLPETIGYDKFIFILQSTRPPHTDTYLMELYLMLDAIRRSTGSYGSLVTTILPYFGYARQDKKDLPRSPIAAAFVARLIQLMGAKRIMAMDIHSEETPGNVDIPFDLLYASYVLLPALRKEGIMGPDLCVFSPDMGGIRKARFYRDKLSGYTFGGEFKDRNPNEENETKTLCLLTDDTLPHKFIRGKNVLIIDDIIDTGGSVIDAVTIARERGAENIFVVATHGIFSGPGVDRMLNALNNGDITKLIVTDTVPFKKRLCHPSVQVVSVAPLIAEAIQCTITGQPLGERLIV